MGTGSPGPNAGSGRDRRIEDVVARIEMEVRDAIAYVNANVVPQARRESIAAMRTISEKLRDLADRMEKATAATAKGPEQ